MKAETKKSVLEHFLLFNTSGVCRCCVKMCPVVCPAR